MTKISIIIPVYNAEKHLDMCVDSIVNQTYKNIEIILVNDGSSDNSGAVCDKWATVDPRIKVIHKQNGGVSSARNSGLEVATGDYIIFADVHSFFEDTVIEKCMAEITAHSPDLLVCAIKASSDDTRGKIYIDGNMYTRYEYTENIAGYITTGVGFDTVENKIFASHIISSRSLRFIEDMPLVSDELFNCRYFAISSHIRCIPELLCNQTDAAAAHTTGSIDYLSQGKTFSQALIDAVQSKGLYNAASRAIGENYQKILYRHLTMLCAKNDAYSVPQRITALEQLSQSSDDAPLSMYLATLPGIKNKAVYQMYKLHQWKLLLSVLGK